MIQPHSRLLRPQSTTRQERSRFAIPFRLAAGLLLAFCAFAQNSQITGRVTDPSDSAVAGAKVTAVNTGTGLRREGETTAEGYYTFPLLPRGSYTLSVVKSGFQTAERTGLTVDDGQVARLDIQLNVGTVVEKMEVSGAAALLETENTAVSTVVTTQKIQSMPLINRNVMALAGLVPGVRPTQNLGNIAASAVGSSAASIGGGAPSANASLVDGVAADEVGFGGIMISLSVDATEEFRIVTHNASAEYGHSGGGVIAVVSKSGTNTLKGSLYEFFRNKVLNANNYFSNRTGAPRPVFIYNNYGVAVGGPVSIPKVYEGKDKTFWFFNWERFQQQTLAQGFRTVPTALQKQGDFSSTLDSQGRMITVYDPSTTRSNPAQAGTYLRDPFAGNRIPANRISPVAAAVAPYYPSANTAGVALTQAQNYFGQDTQVLTKNVYGIKIDHNFTPTRRVFGRYTYDTAPRKEPNLFGNLAEPGTSDIAFGRHSAAAGYTQSITPTLLFEGKLGFNRYTTPRVTRSFGFDVGKIELPSSLNAQMQIPLFPRFSISDVNVIGAAPDDQIIKANDTYSANGSVTWIRSSHTVKMGGEARLYRNFDSQFLGPNVLGFNFTRGFTQGPNPNVAAANAGYGFASFLLGAHASGDANRASTVAYSVPYYGFFIQDDWKVSPRLTLNLGLRWDLQRPYTDRFDTISNFDPAISHNVDGVPLVGGLIFPGNGGLARGDREMRYRDFSPRFGVSYQFDKRTVIRSSYGIFYLPITGISTRQGVSGFSIQSPMTTSADGGLTPLYNLSNPLPSGITVPPGPSQGLRTGLGTSVSGNLRGLWGGYSQQWSLNVQREIPGNWIVEIGYSGNRGVSLPANRAFRYLPASQLSLGTALQELVDNPYAPIIKTGPLSLAKVTRGTLLNRYAQYTGASGYDNWANSIYHALTARIERRFTNGLALLAAYTFSKTIDDNLRGAFGAGGDNSIQNWDDLRRERAISTVDLPQRLVVSATYELPFFRQSTKWLRNTLGGWQMNGIMTLQSGNPISITAPAPAFGGFRPNASADPNPDNQNIERWFNPGAFATIAPFTFGNLGRVLPRTRTDGLQQLDFSLLKAFWITERIQLQLRGEATNFTNTPTFGAPGSVFTAGDFGVVRSLNALNGPRQIQIGLKLSF